MLRCCNCGKEIHKPPMHRWCTKCYNDWKDDILARKPWTVYLANLETNRRYKEKSMWEHGFSEVFLGTNDVMVRDGRYVVVKIRDLTEKG